MLDVVDGGSLTTYSLPPFQSYIVTRLGVHAGEDVTIPEFRYLRAEWNLAISFTYPGATSGSIAPYLNGSGDGLWTTFTGTAGHLSLSLASHSPTLRVVELYGTIDSAGHSVEVSGVADDVAPVTTALSIALLPVQRTPLTIALDGARNGAAVSIVAFPQRGSWLLSPPDSAFPSPGPDGSATSVLSSPDRGFSDHLVAYATESLTSAAVTSRRITLPDATNLELSLSAYPPIPARAASLSFENAPGIALSDQHLAFHWELNPGTEPADLCFVIPSPFEEGPTLPRFIFFFDPEDFPSGARVPPMPGLAPRTPTEDTMLACYASDEVAGVEDGWRIATIGTTGVTSVRSAGAFRFVQGGFSIWWH